MVIWLSWIEVNLLDRQPWCSLIIYFTYVFGFLSVWIVVAFTVERFIVVCFPLRGRHLISSRRALIVIICLTVFALTAYNFAIWTNGVMELGYKSVCMPYTKYVKIVTILTNMDTIFTLVIPSITIFALNTAIIVAINKVRKELQNPVFRGINSQQMTENCEMQNTRLTDSPELSSDLHTNRNRRTYQVVSVTRKPPSQQERSIRSTKILLVVSSVFVVLNLPSHVLRLRMSIQEFTHTRYQPTSEETAAQQITEVIYYINFAINFVLYSLCGQNFRRGLKAQFGVVRRRASGVFSSRATERGNISSFQMK